MTCECEGKEFVTKKTQTTSLQAKLVKGADPQQHEKTEQLLSKRP